MRDQNKHIDSQNEQQRGQHRYLGMSRELYTLQDLRLQGKSNIFPTTLGSRAQIRNTFLRKVVENRSIVLSVFGNIKILEKIMPRKRNVGMIDIE